MKKIIFFILCFSISLVAMLVSVSASNFAPDYSFGKMAAPVDGISQKHIFGDEEHGKGDHQDGWYHEGAARVELKCKKNGVTTTVTYPSYYILKNDSTLVWDFETLSDLLELDVVLNVGDIVAMEIPYGITAIPACAFVLPGAFDGTITEEHPHGHVDPEKPNETLKYVKVSNSVLTIGNCAFAHCTNLATFNSNVSDEGAAGLHNHQMIQSIGYRAFHGCAKLTAFNFNNHLVSLGEGAFEGCSFHQINLSKCVELKVIPAHCFHESGSSTSGDGSAIILSSSIEVIGDGAFEGAKAETIFLGTGVEIIGHNAIYIPKANYLIIPGSIQTIYEDSIKFGANSYKLVVAGTMDLEKIEAILGKLEVTGLDLKHMDKSDKILENTKAFFRNTNFCVQYLGGHSIDHNSQNITSVSYLNGIDHQGVAMGDCGVCLQPVDTGVKLTPIIVAKGYSICTFNGLYAFTDGFEVYHDALAVYERIYGECEIGIVFILAEKYNPNLDLRSDIKDMGLYFDENSLLTSGQVTYASIEYIMTYSKGLVYEDAQGNEINRGEVPIVISAYLLHKENKTDEELAGTSLYVQDKDDICIAGFVKDKDGNDKYATVSYNSIYGNLMNISEEEPAYEIVD